MVPAVASPAGARHRLETLERVHAALARLRELGPLAEVLAQAPAELAESAALDRVLVTRVESSELQPVSAWFRGDPGAAAGALDALGERPLRLEYPLIEAELVRLRRATIVPDPTEHPRVPQPPPAPMDGSAYVAAPIVLDGRTIGFVHADRLDPPVEEADCDAVWTFADGLAYVTERAVLRRRVREQRRRLRHLVAWTDALVGELSDSAIGLDAEGEANGLGPPSAGAAPDAGIEPQRLEDLLTRRELDVLRLMARGASNRAIARELVVSEGTVKFHVKNVLRKLGAANRVEATTRYLEVAGPRARHA
jgi:DNA-binding CsgD family transcriptional regulator